MTWTKLDWFQLRFPQDLEQDAVMAVLSSFSGLPSRARLVLELSATATGMSHRLGVSPSHAELVTASLRAAIPSLRLEAVDAPPTQRRGLLWQLAPRVAALRTDDLAAIAAGLLSSLFPLGDDEVVSLRWRLRSAPRPPLPAGRYDAQDGRERIVRAKLALPGVSAYGELSVMATEPARRSQLAQRTAAVLWSLTTPYGRLSADPYWLG